MSLREQQLQPDWELLVSWIAVVETGSVSGAARILHVSQGAVSQRIKQLEAVFTTILLDRTRRPTLPTAAGYRLYEDAKELLTRADQMMEGVRRVSRAKRMIIRFGCVDSFAAIMGPLLIKALSNSSHQIRIWSGITPQLDAQIEGRQLDLAVTTSHANAPGISRWHLFTERFYVIAPSSFEMCGPCSLSDLNRNLQFIRYSARSVMGRQVDEYLQSAGESLERTCEFDATDPILSLVASGVGFALTTPFCIWHSWHSTTKIQVLPLSAFTRHGRQYPELSRKFFLAYREGELGTLSGEVRDLIRLAARRQISKQITSELKLAEEALWVPEGSD